MTCKPVAGEKWFNFPGMGAPYQSATWNGRIYSGDGSSGINWTHLETGNDAIESFYNFGSGVVRGLVATESYLYAFVDSYAPTVYELDHDANMINSHAMPWTQTFNPVTGLGVNNTFSSVGYNRDTGKFYFTKYEATFSIDTPDFDTGSAAIQGGDGASISFTLAQGDVLALAVAITPIVVGGTTNSTGHVESTPDFTSVGGWVESESEFTGVGNAVVHTRRVNFAESLDLEWVLADFSDIAYVWIIWHQPHDVTFRSYLSGDFTEDHQFIFYLSPNANTGAAGGTAPTGTVLNEEIAYTPTTPPDVSGAYAASAWQSGGGLTEVQFLVAYAVNDTPGIVNDYQLLKYDFSADALDLFHQWGLNEYSSYTEVCDNGDIWAQAGFHIKQFSPEGVTLHTHDFVYPENLIGLAHCKNDIVMAISYGTGG